MFTSIIGRHFFEIIFWFEIIIINKLKLHSIFTVYKLNKFSVMLKKYESFKKISKTSECSFYEAVIRENNQKVLIKRIKQIYSWSQILTSTSLKLQSKEYYFPKLIQMFKSKGSYFIVYQKPSGQNLSFQSEMLKKQLGEFYQFFNQLVKVIVNLKKQVKDLYIYPEWIYLHRNSIKICHFEPYFERKNKNEQKRDNQVHVFMYNLKNRSIQLNKNSSQNLNRVKNINFNLGYIAYHLLLGQVTEWEDQLQIYNKKIKEIQSNCKQRILKQTKDDKLANIVRRLLECRQQESEEQSQVFSQFMSFVKKRNAQFNQHRTNQSHRIVEVTMQKMNLFGRSSIIKIQKKKKSTRPCCIHKTYEDESENQDLSPQNNQYKLIESYKLSTKRKSFKKQMNQKQPATSLSKPQSVDQKKNNLNKHKINISCFLPTISTERKLRTTQHLDQNKNTRKTMFRSADNKVQP